WRASERPSRPMFSLIGSLLFAVAQLAGGGWVVAWGARGGRWRRTGAFLLMLLGAWFFWSGATELFVSGMELAQRLRGVPTAATFAAWRSRADTLLVLVTVALALAGVLFLALRRAGALGPGPHREGGDVGREG